MAADAYGVFMGRWAEPLAADLLQRLRPRTGDRAVDVGCGPGTATGLLVERLGASAVSAVDPSRPFVAAARRRFPAVDVREGSAEVLPFADADFDLAIAHLVVHFMADPVAGLREMARVTRPGGLLSASVWDTEGGTGPLTPFWDAVRELDAGERGENDLAGAREGHLAELCSQAGWRAADPFTITVRRAFASFDDWWEPYTYGVGPAGGYVARLDAERREALRATCATRLPEGPFELSASAWCVIGRA